MTTQDENISLAQFIAENKITMRAADADANPNMADSANMNHYRCTLRMGRKRFVVPFSQGYGITREPSAADVLDCLASDAAGFENAGSDPSRSFENWAGEYGYGADSRTAERTFRVIGKQAQRLQQFLGDELYDRLLWHTERQ